MKKKLIVIIFIGLLAMNLNGVVAEPEETEDVFKLPDPSIVFIYPEFFENGSSFPIGEYLYFTMTGNLSLFNYPNTNFELTLQFDNSSDFIPKYHDGYGTWVIEPQFTKNLEIDVWHTLNVNMSWFNVSSLEILETVASNMSLFASSEYFAVPLSIVPVNYPNNSIIPLANVKGMSEKILPFFKATGWKKGNMTDIPHMSGVWNNVSIGKPVDAHYVWDNGDTWNEIASQQPFYYHYNKFYLKPIDLQLSEGLHNLTIKIENDTHEQNTTFTYTFVESIFDYDRWYFGPDSADGDLYFLTANRSIIFQNQSFNGDNNVTSVIYNMNDGSANQTLLGSNFNLPLWNSSYVGSRYMSYWLQIENYTNFVGVRFTDPTWTPEFRLSFNYEHIVPQINLHYPINDTGKSGMIPLIWNLDTFAGGWWNYSDYRFNIYYETDTISKTLTKQEWSPIDTYTHADYRKETKWYYKSAFQMYQRSAPAIYSFEFNLTSAMLGVGMGSSVGRNLQDNTQIRFIIEETTTNTVYNESEITGVGASSYASVSGSGEPIASATSGWINAVFSAYSATAPTESTTSSNMPPSGETTNGAPIPFGSPLIILMGVIVLTLTKRKEK